MRFTISAPRICLQSRCVERRRALCGQELLLLLLLLPSLFSLFFFAVTSVSREDERIRVRAASAAGRPPCLITTWGSPRVFVPPFFFSWSHVSPPSIIWERMRLLVFATLLGVLLDTGKCNFVETAVVSYEDRSHVHAQKGNADFV